MITDLNDSNFKMKAKMESTRIKSVIYARVSSVGERQSTTRQVEDLKIYADKNGYEIQNVFEEHISGATKNKDRIVLNECLDFCMSNGTDILLLSELSRLGRNVDEVLANVRYCKDHHLNIYFQKEGISIFDRDGKENPFLTIMIAVLGTCAQMERDSIYYRLQSGRKQYVEKCIKETGKSGLGRKEGYRKSKETKKEQYKEVLKLLKGGYPIRKVVVLTGTSESTIVRLKKEFAI
ncbi:MAG: recombinase family protein [Muribaculaceae bacterium]|nr:recombinase family protein [Muribaculaceae bacterium]